MSETKDLGHVLDEMNEAFDQAEVSLREANLGVAASVPLKSDGKTVGELFFRKCAGEWGLHIVAADGQEFRISSAPKDFRFLAAERLQSLLDALRRKADQELTRARDARLKVDQFVKDMKAGKL